MSAYVLLGDPGAGKTELFKREAEATGGKFISARDFMVLQPKDDWQEKTLFIDGLDETRAGDGDARSPLDRIRTRLDELNYPQFRLSCRAADWLGSSDREALNSVSSSSNIRMLHLDALTEKQIFAIIEDCLGEEKTKVFIRKARDYGLEGLLDNPQTLHLLLDSIRGEVWPESRSMTYELASRQLAKESNKEHLSAKRSKSIANDTLLEAAGYLSAVTLLADKPCISIRETSGNDLFLPLLTSLGTLPFEEVLRRRLFKSLGGERFEIVHRSVAEYLAARFMSAKVMDSLPLGRVLSLMLGSDGGVVSGLRGLHAWLAFHCPTHRDVFIDNDPLGVVLYGDTLSFSTQEKLHILTNLQSQARKFEGFRWQDWSAVALGTLSTPDMIPHLRKILATSSRHPSDQALVECVIDALRYGQPLLELAEPLLLIARDVSWWMRIRKDALYAYVRNSSFEKEHLNKLLDDIHAGVVEDSEDELLGFLLELMYPDVIMAQDVFDYLHPRKRENLIGSYFMFWAHELLQKTNDLHLPILLDGLAERYDAFVGPRREYMLRNVAGQLLARALEVAGDTASDQQLYKWLKVGFDEYGHLMLDKEYADRIAKWFEPRPDRYKNLLAHCTQECSDKKNIRYCFHQCMEHLYTTVVPGDLGLWFLTQAEAAKKEALALQFFEEAVHALIYERGCQGLSLDFFELWVRKRPKFQDVLTSLLCCDISDHLFEHAEEKRKRKMEQQQLLVERLRYCHEHISDIREGKVHPSVLHNLAIAYFGRYYDVHGDTPLDRLQDYFDHDNELIDACISGFKNVLYRNDIPAVDKIIDLKIKGDVHYILLPCLAGAKEFSKDIAENVLSLSEEVQNSLIGFHYTYGENDSPGWFDCLVRKRPEMVARVLVVYISKMMKKAKGHIEGIYSLARNEAYEKVARQAVLPLLAAVPIRLSKDRLWVLENLLKAAIRIYGKADILPLIEQKLQFKQMNALQRVYWLASGFVLSPAGYSTNLFGYIGNNKARVQQLSCFFQKDDREGFSIKIPECGLAKLIDLFAPICSPERPNGAHFVSSEMEKADLVQRMINQLGALPTLEAERELLCLLANPSLAGWHRILQHALFSQRVTRRETLFRHPSIVQVEKTLANLQPANTADLAALTLDYLLELKIWIRHDNTDPYKFFWKLNSCGKPDTPNIEDICRNFILGKLKERIGGLGVDCQPEGHYAENKRADIRVSFGGAQGFNVPIEIKRDKHPDLWSAIHQQLIPRYTRDPGADGHGIYLVLWFGGEEMRVHPFRKKKPPNAEELEKQLVNILTPKERKLITVVVLDVASPT